MTIALPPVDPALVEEAAALSPEDAAARHAQLAAEVDRANELYYAQDAPELTDAEYDQLFRRLVALETAHPSLTTPESPTQRVGGTPSGTFSEVRHRRPMLSLGNAFSHDELRAFDARVRKGLGSAQPRRSRRRTSAMSRNSRSTVSPSRSATSAAGSSRARPAATARPART